MQNKAICTKVDFLIVFLFLHFNESHESMKELLAFCVSTHIGLGPLLWCMPLLTSCLLNPIHIIAITDNNIGMTRGLFAVAVKKDTKEGCILAVACVSYSLFVFEPPVIAD